MKAMCTQPIPKPPLGIGHLFSERLRPLDGHAPLPLARKGSLGTLSPQAGRGESIRAAIYIACPARHFIVGMTNSAPSLTPEGQREVTVLVLV
jgi:hypothetical protein